MHVVLMEDCAKRRLTDERDILTAVNLLESHGIAREDLAIEMSKVFYVDLDGLNRILERPR